MTQEGFKHKTNVSTTRPAQMVAKNKTPGVRFTGENKSQPEHDSSNQSRNHRNKSMKKEVNM